MKILCQAGHQGITTGATGAPYEQAFNIRVRDRLSQILISKGFQLYLIGATISTEQASQDYDLALAIHYDANIYGTGGGFVDYPDPSADSVNAESKRIRDAIASEYFKHTGIVEHNERSNANTKFYYLWSQLSAKTPCVIIECGVGLDAHDNVILNDTERVASALARGICKAFSVAYDTVTPPVAQPSANSGTSGGATTTTTTSANPPQSTQTCGTCTTYKDKLKQINTLAGKTYWFYKGTFSKIKELSQ